MSSTPQTRRAGAGTLARWQAPALFLLLMVASARFATLEVWRGEPFGVARNMLYQAATLAFNYFEFGAVRRGLAGSIAYLLSKDAAVATIAFHFLSAAGVAATAVWLFRRIDGSPQHRAAAALTLFIIMARWGDDAGRIDMAVAFGFGCATLAYARGRPALAAAFVGIGLFVHEASFIFGLPLLVALTVQAGGVARVSPRQRAAVGAVLAVTLLLYAGLVLLPHADLRTMVDTVRSKFVPHEHVDWAIYYAVSGLRGVQTSVCQNLTDPSYWVHPGGGLVLIGLTAAALLPWSRRGVAVALLAALPGFVFLSVLANDISRWALFACFNIWLVAAVAPQPPAPTRSTPALRLALALMLIPLVLYRPGRVEHRIYAASPLLEAVALKLGGPRTPSVAQALERCDPDWREVLDGR